MGGEILSSVDSEEVLEPGEEDVMADRPEDQDCWDYVGQRRPFWLEGSVELEGRNLEASEAEQAGEEGEAN
jgi:hypothetical protein